MEINIINLHKSFTVFGSKLGRQATPNSVIRVIFQARGFHNNPQNRRQFTPRLQTPYDYPATNGITRTNTERDRRGPLWHEWRMRLMSSPASTFTGLFTLEGLS